MFLLPAIELLLTPLWRPLGATVKFLGKLSPSLGLNPLIYLHNSSWDHSPILQMRKLRSGEGRKLPTVMRLAGCCVRVGAYV